MDVNKLLSTFHDNVEHYQKEHIVAITELLYTVWRDPIQFKLTGQISNMNVWQRLREQAQIVGCDFETIEALYMLEIENAFKVAHRQIICKRSQLNTLGDYTPTIIREVKFDGLETFFKNNVINYELVRDEQITALLSWLRTRYIQKEESN